MTNQLPPQGPSGPDDKLPGEAELTALYRKLPKAEPGPALNDAVRRMAAAAVPSRRRARWPVALGTAATLVLAAALGWRMREMPSAMPPAPSAPTTVEAKAVREPATPSPLPASIAPRQIAPAEKLAAPAPKAQAPAITPARMAMKVRPAVRLEAGMVTPPGKPIPPPPPSAAAANELASPAPAPQEATAERRAAPAGADKISSAERAPRTGAAMPDQPVAALVADSAGPAGAQADPAEELKHIRQLFARGQTDEARQRLRAFHRAHPQWALPEALRRELRKP